MKVLQGTLTESQYNVLPLRQRGESDDPPADASTPAGPDEMKLEMTRNATLTKDSVTYLGGRAVHSIENASGERCYSLHLYAPPCQSMFKFCAC